jgi:methylmalonyl-CoA epimerase
MPVVGLDHVAIAVDDIQQMASLLRDQLGLTVEDFRESAAFNMKLAFVTREGQRQLELIEIVGDSSLSPFVPEKKPALHHIALRVKDIEGTIEELRAKGMQPVEEKPIEGRTARLAFINPDTSGGIMLELVERPE